MLSKAIKQIITLNTPAQNFKKIDIKQLKWFPESSIPKEIPVISVSNMTQSEKLQHLERVSQLSQCFFIKDHGITDECIENLLNVSIDVFNSEYKQKLVHPSQEIMPRGYSGYRTEDYTTLQFKQGLDQNAKNDDFIAEYRCYNWCSEDNIYWSTNFQKVYQDYYQKNVELGMHLIKLIRKILGKGYLPSDEQIQNGDHNFRVLDYLGKPSQNIYRLLPHCDTGLITLLYQLPAQSGFVGLQAFIGDRFIQIPPVKGYYLINFGETINALTQSKFKPFMHQVKNPTDSFQGSARMSIPFFFQPKGDLQINEPPETNFSEHYNKNGKTTYASFVESICKASYK